MRWCFLRIGFRGFKFFLQDQQDNKLNTNSGGAKVQRYRVYSDRIKPQQMGLRGDGDYAGLWDFLDRRM